MVGSQPTRSFLGALSPQPCLLLALDLRLGLEEEYPAQSAGGGGLRQNRLHAGHKKTPSHIDPGPR